MAATVGAAALIAGATVDAPSRPDPVSRSARATDWEIACGERCELRTIAQDSRRGVAQWVGLVYTSATDARVVSGSGAPLVAAVTFDDGGRFVFDICDSESCRLPPASSADLLRRLRNDDTGTLRVRLPTGGTTGLIDLPRLNGKAARFAGSER